MECAKCGTRLNVDHCDDGLWYCFVCWRTWYLRRYTSLSLAADRAFEDAHKSTRLGICIFVMRLRYDVSGFQVRKALSSDRCLGRYYEELQNTSLTTEFKQGAQLICRPGQKNAIIKYLREKGVSVHGRTWHFDDMEWNSRHIIMAAEFKALVDRIVFSTRMKPMPVTSVPAWVVLTEDPAVAGGSPADETFSE